MKVDKLNVVIAVLCGILFVQLYYNSRKRSETFLSKYDVLVSLKIMNALKPASMETITFDNVDTLLADIRTFVEKESSENDDIKTLVDKYNEVSNFEELALFYKENKTKFAPNVEMIDN